MPARTESRARMQHLHDRLARGLPLLLDGAGGTALEDQGIDISGPLWSAHALETHWSRVVDLHAAYAQAGARVHTPITFRIHAALFADRGGHKAWRATLERAVQAVEVGLHQVGTSRDDHWIAGSMAPVGESYRVNAVPEPSVLEREHTAQAQGLKEAGVDLLLVETMARVREARIGARAAKATGLPVWVSFVVGGDTRLLSGEPLETAVEAIQQVSTDAVLINCASLENTTRAIKVLREHSQIPWGAYANGSPGDPIRGWGERVHPETYAETARGWIQSGARIIGSCCATNPDTTRALSRVVEAG